MGKREEGFTLMEMIISVGTLALISGFILQMFIVSTHVNQKARDTDIAAAEIVHAIEIMKSMDAIEDYMQHDFYAKSVMENDNGQLRFTKCYDKDWNALDIYHFNSDALSDQVQYKLVVNIHKEMPVVESVCLQFSQEEEVTGSSGMLCDIYAEIYDVRAEIQKQRIADINASKYFNLWVMQ